MTKIIRQGDLALIPIHRAAVATAPVPPEAVKVTLATGEDSGHAHVVIGQVLVRERILTVSEQDANLVVEPATQAWRHDPIAVPPGEYEIRVQREYTPAGFRQVGD